MATKFTADAYRRTNGKDPKGYGTWAFQRSTTRNAYWGDLYGELEFFAGTLTEAKKAARASMSDAEYLAILG